MDSDTEVIGRYMGEFVTRKEVRDRNLVSDPKYITKERWLAQRYNPEKHPIVQPSDWNSLIDASPKPQEEWTCQYCDSQNPNEKFQCHNCGAPKKKSKQVSADWKANSSIVMETS